MKKKVLILGFLLLYIYSCKQDDEIPNPISPVNFNLSEMPYESLSEYNFYKGDIKNLEPVYGVLPYNLINKLFTDYAHKKRHIWMPENAKANYVSDNKPFNFPVGTILIKNFFYKNTLPNNETKIIETRLMIKKDNFWVFATYQWDEEQTDANYIMDGVDIPISWIENNQTKEVIYRIPPGADCQTCHQSNDNPEPIGPKPQNINSDFNYSNDTKNQLLKWEEFGYLDKNYPQNIQTVVKWNETSETLENRVRAYLDINCAHCHSDEGYCNYRSMRFAYDKTTDPDNLGICITHQEPIGNAPWLSHIIKPERSDRSVLFYRLNTTDETVRMPLKGRSLIHTEAVTLIEEWINSLTQNCN